eukprot:TRINITY_DN6618_c0_g1_i1.p1 TRINITY_DN6618_c0_g1~~TRINITY_DN6618_c0_g1_i1.p1  ORF type:complete len:337 (+),score=65.22 TRINITY_DN6618_c0_g1_i1:140-1150(+)
MEAEEVKSVVQDRYAQTALHASDTVAGAKRVATAFGYSTDELDAIPPESNMGLSCGNPIALASIKDGETVVDLGSGGGFDCFLAARRVGSSGKVIGVDMTSTMIELAQKNKSERYPNVEFVLGDIENLPIESNTVDCVISNCVINLVPNKEKAFQEIFRILKPGGRVAISDLCLKKELPQEMKHVEMLIGCIAGAVLTADYQKMILEAGFQDLDIVDSQADLAQAYSQLVPSPNSCNETTAAPKQEEAKSGCCSSTVQQKEKESKSGCCSSTVQQEEKESKTGCCTSKLATVQGFTCCASAESQSPTVTEALLLMVSKYPINDYAGSYKIFAIKPQ